MNFHPSVNSQQLQHLSQVDETFILRQPDEILLQQLIFATNTTSNFYNLSLVCKKINTLMKNEALIAFFFAQPDNFSSFGKKVVQFLTTLAAKNENIKNIPFRLLFKSYDLDDEALIKLGTLTKLQSINIARFHQISKSGFDIFFTNCQNLKHFECNQDLDYETLMTLVKTNKQLKSFDFGKSSEEEFITLLPYLRNLESLTFPHREHAYRTSLSENACLALVKSCPNLKEFKIFKFDRYPGDSFMSHFVKVCSNTLQSINLYAADNNQLIAWATRFTS